MKKILHLILLFLLCLPPARLYAQESTIRQIYNQAESEYETGRIEQAIQLLHDHLDHFNGLLKQSAYRLLALCYLSEDRDEDARYYAERLIKLNNYYNSADDPARFQDLVSQLKEGLTATITTASSQSETINEAPAPITIITSKMIEELGYNKNLAQILASYVPGMTEILQTKEGVNMSMHGAYADGQEMILVMETGHRLNSRLDNVGHVSYSISTEKIDHIEVLRGPASSLYGDVALSAVVNIITKSGRSVDGVKAKYGYGTFDTHKADLLMGTQFMDADIFAWASIYKSDGQIRHFSDGKGYLSSRHHQMNKEAGFKWEIIDPDLIYIDGYKDSPSYDVGLRFQFKGFELLLNRKNFKKIQKLTSIYGGYDYNRYNFIHGIKPGNGNESTHAEISYSHQLGKLFLNASLYGDLYNFNRYEVEYDSLVNTHPYVDPASANQPDENHQVEYETETQNGMFYSQFMKEHTMGGMVKASTNYHLGNMKGNVLAGSQFEHFSLHSSQMLSGYSFSNIQNGYSSSGDIIDEGKENHLSFFIQDKHYFMPQFILNAGIRYDFKFPKKEDVVRSFSPRLALLYVPSERFSLKLSYSEAYANLSYYNRYMTKTDYSNPYPQHLTAIQCTALGTFPSQHFSYEANLFYNKYTHLLCWMERSDYSIQNDGKLTNIGFEGIVNYSHKRLSANLSVYYCHDISSNNYYYNTEEKLVGNVPHFTLHLHGAWKLADGNTHKVKVYGHTRYLGKKLNYTSHQEDDFFLNGKWLFDLGVKYRYRQLLTLSLDCENLFNTDYYICGPSIQDAPVFHRGRTLMGSISFQL